METIKWPKIVVPGVVWGILLVGLTIVLGESFPQWEYLPWILVVLNALIKAIEVNTGTTVPKVEGAEYRALVENEERIVRVEKPNKLNRWLIA